MTHDILQSDLDLARRLIQEKRPDPDIVQALVLRRVDSAKAAQAVNDLRLGKQVRPADPVFPEFASPPQPRSARPRPASDSGGKSSSGSEKAGKRILLSASEASKRPARRFLTSVISILVLIVCAGLFYVGWLANRNYHATTAALLDQWESASPKDETLRSRIAGRRLNAAESARWNAASPATTNFAITASNLVLELQPEGLLIGHNLVTPRNAFRAISEVIGFPTRTNTTDQPNTVIYAYDHHGLLVYSGEGAGDDVILLDFDAVGGTNGTTQPFAGTLKFETNLINAATDAGALASIKELALTNPGADAGTFRGRCHDLDLYFAYLKTRSRLSVVQINLKTPR